MHRVEFDKLKFKGAQTFFEETTVPLKDQGLVQLRGEVVDHEGKLLGSNGAGKSKIPGILYHLLYEKTSTGVRKKGLLHWTDPVNFLGELTWRLNGDLIRVEQSIPVKGSGKTSLWVNGDDGATQYTQPDTAKRVASLTGMTPDQFLGTCYMSQSYTHALLGSKSQRTSYLMQIFGLGIYDEILDALKKLQASLSESTQEAHVQMELRKQLEREVDGEDLNSLEAEFSTLQSDLSGILDQLGKLRTQVASASHELVASQALKKQLSAAGLSNPQDAPVELGKELARHEEARTELQGAQESLSRFTRLMEQTTQRNELQGQLDSMVGVPEEEPDPDAASALHRTLHEHKQALPNVRRLGELSSIPLDIPQRLETLEPMLRGFHQERSQAEGQWSMLEGWVNQLGDEGDKCPMCSSGLDFDLRVSLRKRQQELLEIRDHNVKRSQGIQVLVDAMRQKLPLAAEKQKLLPWAEYNAQTVAEAIQSTQAELDQLQRDVQLWSASRDLRAKISAIPAIGGDTLSTNIAKLKSRTRNLSSVASSVQERIFALRQVDTSKKLSPLTEAAVQSMMARVSDFEARLHPKRQRMVELEHKIKALREKLTRLAQMAGLGDEIQAALDDAKAAEIAADLISVIRQVHLQQAGERLSAALSGPLQTFFPHREFEVTVGSKLQLELELAGGATISDVQKKLSGGEQQKLNLSLIAALMSASSQSSCNLAIFDEPLRWLDEQTRESFFFWLDSLREDPLLDTVILITHDNSIGGKQFDKQWTVRKTIPKKGPAHSRLFLDG